MEKDRKTIVWKDQAIIKTTLRYDTDVETTRQAIWSNYDKYVKSLMEDADNIQDYTEQLGTIKKS